MSIAFRLSKEDRDRIIGWYTGKIKRFGEDVKSLQWKSRESQCLRFNVLAGIAGLGDYSVLDVGCGFGDLYNFLKQKGINFSYSGCDINPMMVEFARLRHSGLEFEAKDFLEMKLERKFDYFFASGVFGIKINENQSFMKSMIKKMFKSCRKGVAFNFLGNKVDYKEDCLYYARSEDVIGFCKGLTERFVLRNDYIPWEFTVYLYK